MLDTSLDDICKNAPYASIRASIQVASHALCGGLFQVPLHGELVVRCSWRCVHRRIEERIHLRRHGDAAAARMQFMGPLRNVLLIVEYDMRVCLCKGAGTEVANNHWQSRITKNNRRGNINARNELNTAIFSSRHLCMEDQCGLGCLPFFFTLALHRNQRYRSAGAGVLGHQLDLLHIELQHRWVPVSRDATPSWTG